MAVNESGGDALPRTSNRRPPLTARLFLFAGSGTTAHRARAPGRIRSRVQTGCGAERTLTPGATWYYLGAEEGPVTVKSSISLTDEQHDFARALVEAGRYPSLSAVLQQGVDLLRRRMDAEELETAAMRELLSRRRDRAFIDTHEMDARLAAMVAGKRRAHGLPS